MRALVIHGLCEHSRLTNVLHTTSFSRHLGGFDVVYANIYGHLIEPASTETFDIGFVTYEVLSLRGTPEWVDVKKRIWSLVSRCRVRVALPQDDYTAYQLLDDLVVDAGFHYVLTPITKNLEVLYPRAVRRGVQFREMLTGYWEDAFTDTANAFSRPFSERTRDLGQRVRSLPPNLGSLAGRKALMALQFAELATENGFVTDVSLNETDTLFRFEWWRFLGDCRFTVGRRGGASLGDPRGRLARRVETVMTLLPSLSPGRINQLCGLSRLVEHDFSAVGPRIFEAAALGVCQILEADVYLDEMEPWKHYVPLDGSMQNRNKVFEVMRDHQRCSEIAREARQALISSGQYSYSSAIRSLVHDLMQVEVQGAPRSVVDLDEPFFRGDGAEHVSQVRALARKSVLSYRGSSTRPPEVDRWLGAARSNRLIAESFLRRWVSVTVSLSSIASNRGESFST